MTILSIYQIMHMTSPPLSTFVAQIIIVAHSLIFVRFGLSLKLQIIDGISTRCDFGTACLFRSWNFEDGDYMDSPLRVSLYRVTDSDGT